MQNTSILFEVTKNTKFKFDIRVTTGRICYVLPPKRKLFMTCSDYVWERAKKEKNIKILSLLYKIYILSDIYILFYSIR